MRLTQLRSFHATAIERGFTRAARLLNVSQPTITTQVRMLEETYRVQLFNRGTGRVSLTSIGQELLKISTQIFALETDAIQLLRDAGELKYGHLRLVSVGPRHISAALVRFKKKFPGIHVTARVANSQEVIESLLTYAADIGVLAQPLHDERFVCTRFGTYPILVFVPEGHRFCRRKSIRPADLNGEKFVFREKGSTTRQLLEKALAAADASVDVVMESSSRDLIREAVIGGLGIGAVSSIEYVPDPRLHPVRLAAAGLEIEVHLVCLAERREARVVRAFREIATAGRSGVHGASAGARPSSA